MDVRNHLVTIFKDLYDVENPNYITLEKALERISKGGKEGSTKKKVVHIRSLLLNGAEPNQLHKQKAYLPCVLFSGKFATKVEKANEETGEVYDTFRADDSLTVHSHVVTIDFDKLEDPEFVKQALSQDNYILACWISPSGNGVKALVKIEDPTKHYDHYNAIIARYSQYAKLDTTSRNPSRVCYESYDEDIYINWNSWVFSDFLREKKSEPSVSGVGFISKNDYSKMKVPMRMVELAEDGDKHHTLIKAATLIGGYVSAGYIDAEVAKYALEIEIRKKNIDDIHNARKTIEDGMRYGMSLPIYEFENKEKDILKEVGEAQVDFVFDYDNVYLEIEKYLSGETEQTFTTGYEALDPFFIWKKSNFIVNLGHSNVGKTYVAMWFAVVASVIHGWKFIIYSAENKPWAILRDLMQFAAQKRITEMTIHERKFYKEFVREHFEFIKNDKTYTYYDIIDMSNKLMSRKHFEYILIDPYNALIRKSLNNYGGEHGYDNEAATNMLSFANNSGTGIWLNLHTYTAARRIKDNEGYSIMPSPDMAEGGGKWDNKADFFTVSHRIRNHQIVQERFVTMFGVDKVRDMDSGGQPHGMDDPFRMKWYSDDGLYFADYTRGNRGQIPFTPLYQEKLV